MLHKTTLQLQNMQLHLSLSQTSAPGQIIYSFKKIYSLSSL